MLQVLVFIFGLTVGSFLNVVIYRTYKGVGFIRGRSYCPFCKHPLEIADLVPLVSFIVLRGRCRWCGKPISWQYPLVELATGASFLALFFVYGPSLEFLAALLLTSFLIIIFVQDLKYYVILDRISIPTFLIACVLSPLVFHLPVVDMAIGIGVAGGFFLLQYVISRGKWIGGGDIRLGAVMGALLGWKLSLIALTLAYASGTVVALFLIILRKRTWSSHMPLGTFLSAATFVCLLFRQDILVWYWNTLF